MNIDDFFGNMTNRPSDSQDFWRLSELVLQLDGQTDGRRTQEGADQLTLQLNEHIDSDAVSYLAFQRAIRFLGLKTQLEIMANFDKVATCVTLYTEAILMGVRFSEAGGHRPRSTSGPTEG